MRPITLFVLLLGCALSAITMSAQTTNKVVTKKTIPTKKVTSSAPKASASSFQKEMLAAINVVRVKGYQCGDTYYGPVPKITWEEKLQNSSKRHANDMAVNNFFEHESSDGTEMSTRVSQAGYKWRFCCENIALGYKDVQSAVKGWLKSEGHCENIMRSEVTQIGAARTGDYWVQDFAAPRKEGVMYVEQ